MAVSLFESHRPREATITVSVSPDFSGDYVAAGADMEVEVNAALVEALALGGGEVVLLQGTYTLAASITFPGNNLVLRGMGRATFIDVPDLAPTTFHGISMMGRTDCTIRDLSIQTAAGGGDTVHCIFIEDGSDSFKLIDITIVDSDSDGIHVEGTTITQGHIHRCHVEAADGNGILVDMDAANFMYRLHVEDCDILACGTQGIVFLASGGNLYCQVVNNIVYGCTGTGILVFNADFSMVRGNICVNNSSSGIGLTNTPEAQVLGNVCQGNNVDGIVLSDSTFITLAGNLCQGNGGDGISLITFSSSCTITGNTFQENEDHGIILSQSDNCTVVGNTCIGNDSGNTGNFDGINLTTCDRILVLGNQCQDQQGWGIQLDDDSNYCKISNNYTALNVAGSINVNGATCDGNEVVFNTVEEGAPVDTGTLTRSYGNYDPSADAFVGSVGASPFVAMATFDDDDLTPSVLGGTVFKTATGHGAARDISMFDDGVVGQKITIISSNPANATTIKDAGDLLLTADWVDGADKTLELVFDGADWYEVARI